MARRDRGVASETRPHDPVDDAPGVGRDDGYRATGRLGDTQRGRTRLVGIALVAVVGIGVVLGALGNDASSLGPVLGDLDPTPTIDADATRYIPPPTEIPRVGILGSPLPERPFPMNAGWLRWLDPRTGMFQGDAQPPDRTDPTLTFADAEGHVVQVCTARGSRVDSLIVSVDVCMFDQDGSLRTRFPVAMLRPERQALAGGLGLVVEAPFAIDATVSRDGRWLWIVDAVHVGASWEVTIHRVDLAAASPAGSRRIRVIPQGAAPSTRPSAEGWLVSADRQIRPVVRASPDGSRLAVTMTEVSIDGAPIDLLNQERVELDASLDPATTIDVAFPAGAAGDLACQPNRSAWATNRHYVTICFHGEPAGGVQPFVRIENPLDMTRDVAIGPVIAAADLTQDDSSWLLDARLGVLYRWSYVHRSFTRFDVATRAGTTVNIDPYGSATSGDPWPAPARTGGELAWATFSGGAAPGIDALSLSGSADGSVLYALGRVPVRQAGVDRFDATIWAIDAATGHALERWTAPGPIDQLAQAPHGGPLIGLVSPTGQFGPGPAVDWRTAMWFIDPRSGAPLEVLGDVRGPGFGSPTLIPPSVAAFAGR